ncbi:MAG: bacteriohemerythrin [Magnetococcales bacterium]|nr:bacteriohemerythrin [Magnetococcales bacterium]
MMTSSANISWNDVPRTNIAILDNDHKRIVETINSLVERLSTNDNLRDIRTKVRHLMIYTSTHLRREEAYLLEHNFPDLEKHKKDHIHLLDTLLEIKDKIINGNDSQKTREQLQSFLIEQWIVGHISKSDMVYAKYFDQDKYLITNEKNGVICSSEVEANLEAQLQDLDDFPDDEEIATDVTPIKAKSFEQEIMVANEITIQAQDSVKAVLGDIAANRPIERSKIEGATVNLFKSIQRNPNATMALAMLQNKDNAIFVHSVNVATYLIIFARIMEFDEQTILNIGMGGMLHDVGLACPSIKTADKTIVNNKLHIDLGYSYLKNTINIPEEVLIIASQHHEREDGSGYPNGINGDKIHLLGKMAGIVNEFDLLTSDRKGFELLTASQALKVLIDDDKNIFDSDLVQKFIKAIGIYPVGTTVKLKNGSVGVVAANDPDALLHPVVNIVFDESGKKMENGQQVDLKNETSKSPLQIKRVEKVKHRKFDPLDALIALKSVNKQ